MSDQKYKKVMIGILGVVVLAAGMYWRTEKITEKEYEAKFAFVAPKKWSKIASGVVQADIDFNTDTKCILFTQDNKKKQAEVLEYVLLSGVDGIITGGMEHSEDTEQVLQKAKEAGVPVVFVDSDVEGSHRNCYIGSNNYEVGKMAGEVFARITDGKGKVCMIVSYNNNSNQQERISGFKDAVKLYPEIQIQMVIEGKSSALYLQKELPKALNSNRKIDSIVCAEGVSSHYCGKILEENGFSVDNYRIVGMDYYNDLAPLIENGTYSALVWQNQYEMGYQAVKYLKDFMDGKERKENILYTDIKLVTPNSTDIPEGGHQEEIKWHVF